MFRSFVSESPFILIDPILKDLVLFLEPFYFGLKLLDSPFVDIGVNRSPFRFGHLEIHFVSFTYLTLSGFLKPFLWCGLKCCLCFSLLPLTYFVQFGDGWHPLI